MSSRSQKNRRSPSGPVSDIQLPIYGSNLLTTASTRYLTVAELGDSPTEVDGQVMISEPGVLRQLTIQNVVPGVAPSFAITYNVRKNGVLIPGATAATTNVAVDAVTIDIEASVDGPEPGAAADLISVQVVAAAFGGGTSPVVRSNLTWAPGARF